MTCARLYVAQIAISINKKTTFPILLFAKSISASHPQTTAASAAATATATSSFEESVDTSSSSSSSSSASSSSSSSGAAAFLALAQSDVGGAGLSLLPEVAALSATGVLVEPYLDGYATSNVTTQIGTHAYLPCRVSEILPISLLLLMRHKYFIISGFVWFI